MSKHQYTPGALVTVGDLEAGDTIFARRNRRDRTADPLGKPAAPVTVVSLTPSVRGTGLVQVIVRGYNGLWNLGWLPTTREFPLAVEA